MDAININEWVSRYGIEHHFIPEHPLQIETRVGEFQADNGRYFQFGTFNYDGHLESIDDWTMVNTIGDGSCLVHSFLVLLSDYYRSLSHANKKSIARAFRLYMADSPIFSEEESVLLRAVGDGEKSDGWLNDAIAEKLARRLGYGLITLCFYQTQFDSPEPQMMSTDGDLPYLIIANTGGVIQDGLMGSGLHYSAVKRGGLYVSPSHLGQSIEDKKAELIDATMNRFIDMPDGPDAPPIQRKGLDRCDSPRKRRSLPNSISAKEARRRAVELGVAKYSDDKEKVCRKLHVLNKVNWFHHNRYQHVSGKKRRTRKKRTRTKKR
jgi:hypothetical protein